MKPLKGLILKWLLVVIAIAIINTDIVDPPNQHAIILDQKASISPTSGINYQIERPLRVKVDDVLYTVPSGYVTDLASIPRFLWGIVAPSEEYYVFPSILHDHMYGCPGKLTRKFADEVFYSFLLERKVPYFKAMQMYFAVRLFGGNHFSANHTCYEVSYEQNT